VVTSLHILLVDDDEIQLALVKEILAETHHRVMAISSATEALAQCEIIPFDLVITDILMPQMDGLEFIRALRARSPKIKIIAASAGGEIVSDFYLTLARDFGAAMMLEKPLTKQKLLAALDEFRHL
jgi:CheY-like chemotaxis protein